MTNAELAEVITLISSPDDLVSKLQESSFDDLPQWTDLEKQYDPQLHSIITDLITYPPKLNDKGNSYRGMKFLELFTSKTEGTIF